MHSVTTCGSTWPWNFWASVQVLGCLSKAFPFFEKGKHTFELEGESSCCFSLGSSLQPTTTAHLVGFDDIEAKLLNSEVQGQDRRVWVHPRHLSSNLQCGTYHIDSLSVKMRETKSPSGCWNVPAGRGVQLQLGYNLREPPYLTTSIHNIHIHPIDRDTMAPVALDRPVLTESIC